VKQNIDNSSIFETQRLNARQLTINDVDPLFEILSDKETMKYYPRPLSFEEVKNWVIRSINSYEENNYGLWGLVLKEGQRFIGQCGISKQNIDGDVVPEIGYHINKQFWNLGLATEAAKASLTFGFEHLKLEEIYVHTFIENKPSQRVALKIGMQLRKEFVKSVFNGELMMPHLVYSMDLSTFISKGT